MIKKLLVSLLAVVAITVAAQAGHKMQEDDKEGITERRSSSTSFHRVD